MISMPEYIDVIIPRGGKGLIERISKDARVPVIKHLDGICHVYIDAEADYRKGPAGGLQRQDPALRDLQHHGDPAGLGGDRRDGVTRAGEDVPGERRGAARLSPRPGAWCPAAGATEEDWDTEYLAPILSIKVVKDLDEAIDHINTHSSQHTDAIMTENYTRARRFLAEVDSSSVMVNASTRFADGFEYGLGAEIGISTDKFHARGPVGLEGLTSVKFIVLGDGHIRYPRFAYDRCPWRHLRSGPLRSSAYRPGCDAGRRFG